MLDKDSLPRDMSMKHVFWCDKEECAMQSTERWLRLTKLYNSRPDTSNVLFGPRLGSKFFSTFTTADEDEMELLASKTKEFEFQNVSTWDAFHLV